MPACSPCTASAPAWHSTAPEGSGVFEVYPAAALASWGFPHKGYKARTAAARPAAEKRRLEILAGVERDGRS